MRGQGEDEGVCRVVEMLASRAQQHLDSCRFRAKYLEPEQKLVLLPAVAADHYLAGLAKAGCNPWSGKLQVRNSRLAGSLALFPAEVQEGGYHHHPPSSFWVMVMISPFLNLSCKNVPTTKLAFLSHKHWWLF